jgi:ligand-binding sensor domain-containing protein
MDNSPLRPAIDRGNELDNNYLMVLGFKFDKKGNLWILNSQAKNANLFVIEKGTNTITSKYTNKLSDNTGITHHVLRGCILDSRGLLWFVNDDYREPAIFCYDTNKNITIKYNTFVNQDGTKYVLNGVHGCAEDKEGNIWLGTNVGPFVILTGDIGKEDVTFYQIKVPRNDGTNLADYLLSGVDIRCMAIDGANRKWFGTSGSGVYVISNDNMEEINHFTSQNSDILSDNINSIAINENNGEVYIATDNGLCSYMSDATMPVETMEKDNVYAYPNPVTPEYTGQITILGLTFNADVKITTATGYLVAEGRSNGGTFIWNGCDSRGKRVASGIYNVITATSTGEKGTVCKIAIIN